MTVVAVLGPHALQNYSPPLTLCTSPVVNLHGQQKALRKSRPVDISQWRQLHSYYTLGQYNEFQFVCGWFLLSQSHMGEKIDIFQ